MSKLRVFFTVILQKEQNRISLCGEKTKAEELYFVVVKNPVRFMLFCRRYASRRNPVPFGFMFILALTIQDEKPVYTHAMEGREQPQEIVTIRATVPADTQRRVCCTRLALLRAASAGWHQ